MSAGRDVVFVGDVHLDRGDPDVERFVTMLADVGASAGRVVLLGDLFNLWIGRRELEQEHHRAVLAAFRDLRARGVEVHYVEGNRDYRVAGAHVGTSLDASSDRGLVERVGDRSILAVHGDLANRADRRYRAWRRLSRSLPAWWAFHALPRMRRRRLADGLERRLRRSNLAYKTAFPETAVREYAARLLARGHDVVVLGHFHEAHDLTARPPSPPGRIVVLPLWRDGHVHLRARSSGEIAFEAWTPG